MPTGPSGHEGLPEPAELHARLAARRHLDWGDPIPTKKQVAAEFGDSATARSLVMLDRATAVERFITDDFLASVRPGTVSYQLQSRVKSPQSLARKLTNLDDSRYAGQPPEDLLRYTVVAPDPDDLVDTTVGTLQQLQAKGWVMDSAHHSYVDGSRYKGLHTFLRCHGELIELQVHSTESIDVKVRTTPLYELERDRGQDQAIRDTARRACIDMSDQLKQPAGITELTELGGVAVSIRSYGRRRGTPRPRPAAAEASTAKTIDPQRQSTKFNRQDGISR